LGELKSKTSRIDRWLYKREFVEVCEERFKPIGKTRESRGIFAVFTLQVREGATFIRAISARYRARGIPYQRYIRQILEIEVGQRHPS
jgi:uncharacterized DUF497 family protein